MKSNLLEKYGNIRFAGFLFFILASIFCLYKIYDLSGKPSDAYKRPTFTSQLKLVSVLGRHGDRAPSDELPKGDKHASKIKFFWPNGMSNLTDAGEMRQFRIGLELRRRYGDFLSYNASHYLAFSSPIYRCQESLHHTLRGLFNIEWSSEMGRRLVDMYNAEKSLNCTNGSKLCEQQQQQHYNHHHHHHLKHNHQGLGGKPAPVLPSGSGSPDEYKQIPIQLETLPVLTWAYIEQCKYRLDHPTSVDKDLMTSKAISELKGVKRLADLLKKQYDLAFNFSVLPHWSTIDDETRLARTRDSMIYADHYLGWINERLPEYTKTKITFFDLYEQLVVYGYRDRITDTAEYIQVGPIVTSIIQSQKAALGQVNETDTLLLSYEKSSNLEERKRFDSLRMYKDKKAVFYSTHDSILHLVMDRLNITYIDSGDFESRFNKWQRHDDVSKFLAGFKMPEFGASLVFELYEMEMKEKDGGAMKTVKKFSYVQAALYNEEDGKYRPVEYKRLKLGSMCRQKFERIHRSKRGRVSHAPIESFYDDDFQLDKELSCPFKLFENITSDYMMHSQQLVALCSK